VPFIFVTGALGEELAIQTFENGASDYVLKDHLDDLGPAVRRALRTAEERRLHRLLEYDRERLVEELNEALAKVKTLSGLLRICSGCKQIRDDEKKWEPLETFFEKHLNVQFSHGLCPKCAPRYFPEADRVLRQCDHLHSRAT
jgi:DNA-binding response OmpR family regulator